MSLPSSGALSIGQIYQECGGNPASEDQDILRIRDLWWFADFQASYPIGYDDNNGFANAYCVVTNSSLSTFRYTVDVNVSYDTRYSAWNGYYSEDGGVGTVNIPQYTNYSSSFFIYYPCYASGECYLNYLYAIDAIPAYSGDYVYSTSFYDYYGKTRYNQYIAL
jgi:hypothetical protein